ncbi:MAG TPA: FtsX-like permease family protein, partial [Opitutaceae bacterium]|nr:FtsX-like permease family protein [Opitutaceae bacterium]
LGLYAVVAQGVNRRTREIGIRMALGANARDVVRAVVRDGMRLTLVGLAVGLVLAAALGVALSKILYGVSALDPGVIAGGTLLLVATTGFACWLPARRAARVDPVIALRAE